MSPQGLVLISGVTGFIGTAVTRAFVDAGYAVRGTARSESSIQKWEMFNPEYKGKVEWAIVEDIISPGAFDKAIVGVRYVVHTASPFPEQAQNFEKEILQPAIHGTQNVLTAIKSEPGVEHLVLTSSFAALLDLSKGAWPEHTYTPQDWNPATYEEAAKSDTVAFAYCASKALAEKLAWDEPGRKFAVTTICPSMVYGPPHQAISSLARLNTSSDVIWQLLSSSPSGTIPTTTFPVGIDVRDVAALHVAALTHPAAKNARILGIAFGLFNSQMVDILKKHAAGHEARLARLPGGGGDEPFAFYKWDSSEGEKILGRKYIAAEKSICDTADRLWEIETQLAESK